MYLIKFKEHGNGIKAQQKSPYDFNTWMWLLIFVLLKRQADMVCNFVCALNTPNQLAVQCMCLLLQIWTEWSSITLLAGSFASSSWRGKLNDTCSTQCMLPVKTMDFFSFCRFSWFDDTVWSTLYLAWNSLGSS